MTKKISQLKAEKENLTVNNASDKIKLKKYRKTIINLNKIAKVVDPETLSTKNRDEDNNVSEIPENEQTKRTKKRECKCQ